MRRESRFALWLVFGTALLLGACAEPPGATTERGSESYSPPPYLTRRVPGDVLPIPAGFPDEGVRIEDAMAHEMRDVWVIGTGTLERILRDDTKRPRHQRFVVRVFPGRTVLIAHNIDLAPRVPVKHGDTLTFRGRYEWNDQGGIVHWTHRDRRDKRAGGWIVWKGQNFR